MDANARDCHSGLKEKDMQVAGMTRERNAS
jgi:hypothetical protein